MKGLPAIVRKMSNLSPKNCSKEKEFSAAALARARGKKGGGVRGKSREGQGRGDSPFR